MAQGMGRHDFGGLTAGYVPVFVQKAKFLHKYENQSKRLNRETCRRLEVLVNERWISETRNLQALPARKRPPR